jgi:hypothetical protein
MKPHGTLSKGRVFNERLIDIPLLLYGVLCICAGMLMYLFGVLISLPRLIFGLNWLLLGVNEWIVWYSGVPIMIGTLLVFADLFVLFPAKRNPVGVFFKPLPDLHVTVALTAYNDEDSIGDSVRDFREHPLVRRVIVVSNNSTDRTLERAVQSGAIAFDEPLHGYGHCVYRCFKEAIGFEDTDLIVLCEGDLTFRAYDIDKLLVYAPHADIVNGTRIVEQLRERHTQLSTFIYYGNFFAAKLLEAKRLGKGTFTDLGSTYKLCRRTALQHLLPSLNPGVNLEFNAHFLDMALAHNLRVVECPITFHRRVGISKGGNVNNRRAFKVGIRMILGLVFGWRATGP